MLINCTGALTVHIDAGVVARVLSRGAFVKLLGKGRLKPGFIHGAVRNEFHPQAASRRFDRSGRRVPVAEKEEA